MNYYSRFIQVLLAFLIAAPAAATSLLPISLQQLSSRADLIFYGSVISNTTRQDDVSGHIATFTEFQVLQLIKGQAAETHTIKQLGGTLPGSKRSLHIQGVPLYQPGENYVVFLPKASSLGFCSPLGLQQGSFTVSTINGEAIVSNGRTPAMAASSGRTINRSAVSATAVQLPLAVNPGKPDQSRLQDFINTVRTYSQP